MSELATSDFEKEKVATESLKDLDCDLNIILAFEPQITSWQNS